MTRTTPMILPVRARIGAADCTIGISEPSLRTSSVVAEISMVRSSRSTISIGLGVTFRLLSAPDHPVRQEDANGNQRNRDRHIGDQQQQLGAARGIAQPLGKPVFQWRESCIDVENLMKNRPQGLFRRSEG